MTSNIFQKIAKLLILMSLSFSGVIFAAETISNSGNEIVKMDRIIAIVDQAVITEQELIDRTRTIVAQLEKQGTELPPENILQKQILERLITDSLQLQLAAQTG
jgi:peptidyl-prolyl cis-trans isomerase SurA